MQLLKIKSIKKSTPKHVYDLTVEDNHNFFITNKQILTHNCDYLTPNAQAILRGVMETYASTSRFIMTCNYPNRIIPALHSRCQGFHVDKIDQTEFTARAATVLVEENVEFDLDTLDTYIKITYPDLRKCLNMLQQNTINHKLIVSTNSNANHSDYKFGMVELFKARKIKEARQLICSKAKPEEMEEIYTWLYQNVDLLGDTEEKKDSAILILKQGLCDHTICADPELNLSATMIKLARLQQA